MDSGAQVSMVTQRYCVKKNLLIYKLDDVIHIEGTGGFEVPYGGYEEVELEVPGVANSNPKC